MKRLFVLGSLAVVGLAGCGGGDDRDSSAAEESQSSAPSSSTAAAPSTSRAAPTSSAAPPTVTNAVAEQAFVNQLTSHGIIPRYGSADGAIDLGRAICDRYITGGTRADVFGVLMQGGMSESEANITNSASIVAFCPTYGSQVTG